MGLANKIISGTVVLTIGEGLGYLCAFVRNVILARLLTRADFGVAATFAMAIALMDLAGKMSVGTLVIQSRDSGRADFMATANLAQLAAGVVSALAILLIAEPLASAFQVPGAVGSFRALALLPLLKGFENLEVQVMVRDLKFLPRSLTEVIPQVFITLAAWPVAAWLKDYRAILVLLVAKSGMSCVLTHLWATRPYRFAIHKAHFRSVFVFGWPLVLNGFVMVAVSQADRFLVGSLYSLSDLGSYAAAGTLTIVPTAILGQVMNSLFLPVLANVQDSVEEFRRLSTLCVEFVSLVAVLYAATVIIAGELLMVAVFGQKYAGGGIILSWLAAVNALRIFRYAPTTAALAKGDSQNSLISNLLRATGLVAAALAVAFHKPLWVLAASGGVGEVLALAGAFWRLDSRSGVPIAQSMRVVSPAVGVIAVALLLACTGMQHCSWAVTVAVSMGLAAGSSVALLCVFRDLRRHLLTAALNVLQRLWDIRGSSRQFIS